MPRFNVKYQSTAVSLNGADTHSQCCSVAQKKPPRQQSPNVSDRNSKALFSCKIGNHRNKPKFYDDNVIELSSDEESCNTTLSQGDTRAQQSTPTTVASSPCTHGGKKRSLEDVIVISDDEASTPPAKKRRRYPLPTRGQCGIRISGAWVDYKSLQLDTLSLRM